MQVWESVRMAETVPVCDSQQIEPSISGSEPLARTPAKMLTDACATFLLQHMEEAVQTSMYIQYQAELGPWIGEQLRQVVVNLVRHKQLTPSSPKTPPPHSYPLH